MTPTTKTTRHKARRRSTIKILLASASASANCRSENVAVEPIIVLELGILDIPDERVPMEEFSEVAVRRVGKKTAGRLLDGVEHNGMPELSRQ